MAKKMIYIDLGNPSDNRCGKEPATEPVNSLLHYTITLVNRGRFTVGFKGGIGVLVALTAVLIIDIKF